MSIEGLQNKGNNCDRHSENMLDFSLKGLKDLISCTANIHFKLM